jgi:hypothetical protein
VPSATTDDLPNKGMQRTRCVPPLMLDVERQDKTIRNIEQQIKDRYSGSIL